MNQALGPLTNYLLEWTRLTSAVRSLAPPPPFYNTRVARMHSGWARCGNVRTMTRIAYCDGRLPGEVSRQKQRYTTASLFSGSSSFSTTIPSSFYSSSPSSSSAPEFSGGESKGPTRTCPEFENRYERWNRVYQVLLQEYYDLYGNLDIPHEYTRGGIRLGYLMRSIRDKGAHLRGFPERKAWLEEKGVTISVESMKTARTLGWERARQRILEYYTEHGNLRIPIQYRVEDFKLGMCVRNIRAYGSFIRNNPARRKFLEEMGLDITYAAKEEGEDSQFRSRCSSSPKHSRWDRIKQALDDYYALHGNLNIPRGYEKDNLKVGSLLSGIRYAATWMRDHPERRKWLEDKGVVLLFTSKTGQLCKRWEKYKVLLQDFVKVYGHVRISKSYKVDGVNLGLAFFHMISLGNFVRYRPERMDWLEALLENGNVDEERWLLWDRLKEPWEHRFEQLNDFERREGHCNVPQQWEENPALGRWCARQMYYNRQGTLSKDRVEALKSIGLFNG